jgi:hypothetical protein
MIFPAGPGVTDGFTLLTFEPESFLVLGWTTPEGGHVMTWAFVLERTEHGSTRLLVRVRVRPGARIFGLPWWAAKYLVSVIHFVMQRKQLIGIARRAEHPGHAETVARKVGERCHSDMEGADKCSDRVGPIVQERSRRLHV